MSCQQELMTLGKPYSRTCEDCGIWGPCKLSTSIVIAKPRAVRLAGELKIGLTQNMSEAADELTRLHKNNDELVKTLQTIINIALVDDGRWAKTIEKEATAAIQKNKEG